MTEVELLESIYTESLDLSKIQKASDISGHDKIGHTEDP